MPIAMNITLTAASVIINITVNSSYCNYRYNY